MQITYTFFLLALFVLSLPIQALVAFGIVFTSGFPIFFRQMRGGKNGKPFVMYKFRTMRTRAEKQQGSLFSKNEANGPVFKIHNDPRFTFLGKFLAHTGLDELPQLYNVLIGDMALFGPRPLPMAEAKRLKPWQQARHAIKPGILSPAILTGKYHEDFDAWMKNDIAYSKKKSFHYDMQLAFRAVKFLQRLLSDEIAD